jgi:hypothetical protein
VPIPQSATGCPLVDQLALLDPPTVDDYVAGASEYVQRHTQGRLTPGQSKTAQIRLSNGLGRALLAELEARLPGLDGFAGERVVSGALRTVNADVSEVHALDGLRLAVEIKPINVAVGRAIWNRFGDIRTFAVNLHLKFPFAVIGGVLAIPTYEVGGGGMQRDTTHLITRAVERLIRAGGRRSEADAAHLLEGVCVVVYDPATGLRDHGVPPPGKGLQWSEFLDELAAAYTARFE